MLIPIVEDGLEAMLRSALPLPADVGDISFDPPASTWSAQLSRITVNLFLYEVARSSQPSQAQARRLDAEGRIERRVQLPMIQLSYLVSAWAGSPRDEHQLLSDVLYAFLASPVIAPEHLRGDMPSTVQLALVTDERNRPRDLWSTLGSTPKAAFTITATVAADAFEWMLAPRGVNRIEGMAAPNPAPPRPSGLLPAEPAARAVTRENGRLVSAPRVPAAEEPDSD
ncbi:MAG: hypothetical protein JWN61_1884 [Pseudonocardiales bacterium]|nr:hypothetical protein [Pseudonocardiales bacterium]